MTQLSSLACHQAKPQTTSLPAAFLAYQAKQLSSFDALLIPTRKTESWKYSAKRLGDLSGLLPTSSKALDPANEHSAALPWETGSEDTSKSATIIVNCFNGLWQLENTADKPAGVSFKAFSSLSNEDAERLLNVTLDENEQLVFERSNFAGFSDGLYIKVEPNISVENEVVLNIFHSESGISFPRVFLEVGKNSSLKLIEHYQSSNDQQNQENIASDSLSNSVVEIEVQENARLQYVRMDMDQSSSLKSIALTRANLMRNSFFESHCLGLGSALGRHDLHVRMLEPGGECQLNGVCVTKSKQHYDNHTCIEHIAPHCQSNENYRCIADDQSQIVFNGRIHIHQDAQKTLGEMSNKNLILSPQAEIDSKPELEIYADDVKCAHGTTIGQLDEEEVYYLKTRGLTDQQARQMLTLGFILEIVRANPMDAVAEYWEEVLSNLLSFGNEAKS